MVKYYIAKIQLLTNAETIKIERFFINIIHIKTTIKITIKITIKYNKKMI